AAPAVAYASQRALEAAIGLRRRVFIKWGLSKSKEHVKTILGFGNFVPRAIRPSGNRSGKACRWLLVRARKGKACAPSQFPLALLGSPRWGSSFPLNRQRRPGLTSAS